MGIAVMEGLQILLEEAFPTRKTPAKVSCTILNEERPRIGRETVTDVRRLPHPRWLAGLAARARASPFTSLHYGCVRSMPVPLAVAPPAPLLISLVPLP